MSDVAIHDGWQQVKLGDVCSIFSGFAFKSAFWKTNGTPVIKITNVKRGQLSLDSCGYVSPDSYPTDHKFWIQSQDVLIALTGYVGELAFIGEQHTKCLLNQRVGCLRTKGDHVSRFLFYVLSTSEVQSHIVSLSTGSAQSNVSPRSIESITILLPPLHEQKAISHILGSLDDKIDQLRKTNTVLEDMASALFKSWFVDFDPVIAKQENRPTGLPKDLDDLFPDSFEDSAFGPIPTGWRVGRIRDYVRISKGVSYKSSELAPSNTALVTLKSFHRGGGYRADGVKSYTGKYKPDQQVHSDDLVVAYTDVTQDALVIGKPARVIADSEYSTLVASCDVGIVRPMSEVFTTAYLYELFLTDDFQNHIYGHSSGTTVLHLSSTGVQSYETHIVPEQLMAQFSVIANDAFAQKKCNIHQIRTLTNLRDTLLPKLISGELRVPDAEQMVAELGL